MSSGDSHRPIHSPATASRVFGGEAVVITPAQNTVRMFNAVGSRIWELSDGEHTVDEIAEVLTVEYAITTDAAQESVGRFVEELLNKGLLELAE